MELKRVQRKIAKAGISISNVQYSHNAYNSSTGVEFTTSDSLLQIWLLCAVFLRCPQNSKL